VTIKLSIACLALIAALIVGGNIVFDKSDPEPAEVTLVSDVVSSETTTLLAFNMSAEVDELRQEKAAQVAAANQERMQRKLAKKKRLAEFRDLPGSVSMDTLESIASCESGGDPDVVSSNGLYHGKYQFHPDTWESVGGEGLPSDAPEAEQDYRAALLYERSGPGQWPVCGS
jgi:hypothetical protein